MGININVIKLEAISYDLRQHIANYMADISRCAEKATRDSCKEYLKCSSEIRNHLETCDFLYKEYLNVQEAIKNDMSVVYAGIDYGRMSG